MKGAKGTLSRCALFMSFASLALIGTTTIKEEVRSSTVRTLVRDCEDNPAASSTIVRQFRKEDP
jgi:hypothetical protein